MVSIRQCLDNKSISVFYLVVLRVIRARFQTVSLRFQSNSRERIRHEQSYQLHLHCRPVPLCQRTGEFRPRGSVDMLYEWPADELFFRPFNRTEFGFESVSVRTGYVLHSQRYVFLN